jgi:hypothetical protein
VIAYSKRTDGAMGAAPVDPRDDREPDPGVRLRCQPASSASSMLACFHDHVVHP